MPAADILTQYFSGLREALEVKIEEQEMSTCRRGAVRRDADVILHINRHGFI
jgi:hypothetical protein